MIRTTTRTAIRMTAAEPAADPAAPAGGELELQRRWAAGDWDGPWLEAGGEPARVAFAAPGRAFPACGHPLPLSAPPVYTIPCTPTV